MKKKNWWKCSNLSPHPLKQEVFSFLTEDCFLTLCCPQAPVYSVMFLLYQRTYYCFIQNINTVQPSNKHGLSLCPWKNHVARTKELHAALRFGHPCNKNIMNTRYTEFGRCPAVFSEFIVLNLISYQIPCLIWCSDSCLRVIGFNVCS